MVNCSTCAYNHTMSYSSSRCNSCVRGHLYCNKEDSVKKDPNIAFRDSRPPIKSATMYVDKIVYVEQYSHLIIKCVSCSTHMNVDVIGKDQLDLNEVRCEICKLQEV